MFALLRGREPRTLETLQQHVFVTCYNGKDACVTVGSVPVSFVLLRRDDQDDAHEEDDEDDDDDDDDDDGCCSCVSKRLSFQSRSSSLKRSLSASYIALNG